jgi:hypothetical protein
LAMSFIVAGRFRVVSFSPRTLMTADPGRKGRLLSSAHLACSEGIRLHCIRLHSAYGCCIRTTLVLKATSLTGARPTAAGGKPYTTGSKGGRGS